MSVLRNSLVSGGIATVATSLAATLLGKREGQPPAAPLNAISHMLWGEEATRHDDLDLKHTAAGLALNMGALTSWGLVQEICLRGKKGITPATALVTGTAISAIAYATDYHLVPKRMTPGFEERLSKKALFCVYAVLALSLGAGALAREE